MSLKSRRQGLTVWCPSLLYHQTVDIRALIAAAKWDGIDPDGWISLIKWEAER